MRKPKRRPSWRVLCPDGRIRAYPKGDRAPALEEAFRLTVDGHRAFPDDPKRWRRCPQGKHRVARRLR